MESLKFTLSLLTDTELQIKNLNLDNKRIFGFENKIKEYKGNSCRAKLLGMILLALQQLIWLNTTVTWLHSSAGQKTAPKWPF